MLLTREIYWSPLGTLNTFLHKSLYIWFIIALVIMCYGIWKHIVLWRKGKKEVVFNKPLTRIKFFLKNVIAQARVLKARRQRDPQKKSYYAAWMHGLIFYGFLALVFGTTIVGLKDYGIVNLYQGWFYAFTKVICQLGGIALIIGLMMGIFRRTQKPQEFKHQLSYSILYAFLVILVLQGFLIQGLRLATEANAPDATFAFVGKFFSYLFPKNLSLNAANEIYSSLWYFHMLTTMAFIALIPYTRALHIVTASLNLLTQRLEPTVKMTPMNFEDPDAEYFGARDIKDFTWKDLLSFDTCTECRRCTDICPANAVDKPLDPRQVILKLRDSMSVEKQFYESGLISHDEIWSCTNCGACVNECPVGIDQLRSIMDLRRYQTLSLGEIPSTAGKAIENIKQYSNPWGLPKADRFKWADGLNLPIITEETPEVEYLYYVGCAGAYDSPNQKVAKNIVQLLKACQVSFAVMGKAEKCTGEPIKRLGDEYSFAEVANSNVEHLNKLKFQKIVTHCPHCFNTLKNDYQEYGGNYEVYHHTQLLNQLIKTKKLKLDRKIEKDVTFHDPCFLGRHNNEYEAPRNILEAVAGLRIHEMEKSRQTASCCGMGGGNMWYESDKGGKIVENRLQHVGDTKAKTLVTGCSFCLINFTSAFRNVNATKDIEIIDISQLALEASQKNVQKD